LGYWDKNRGTGGGGGSVPLAPRTKLSMLEVLYINSPYKFIDVILLLLLLLLLLQLQLFNALLLYCSVAY